MRPQTSCVALHCPVDLSQLTPSPLVSILLPNYNYAHYIRQAIQSVIEQSYSNWELIVCDDGSTDQSREVISTYVVKDRRISLLTQNNGGQASALNAAYAASHGEIICILDADDTFDSTKVASVVKRFQHQCDAGLLVHAMTLVDASGTPLHRIPVLGTFEEGWIGEKVLRRGGRWRYMPSSGLAFRRELGPLGFPIPTSRFVEGAEGFLFTLFPLFTRITCLEEELSAYRIHGHNMGGRLGIDARAARKGALLMTTVVEGVNARLQEMNYPNLLDVEKNLHISLEMLIAHLLEGEPRIELYKRYFSTTRAIFTDDLYTLRQKLFLPMVFGVSTVLPLRFRKWWLDMSNSSGKRTAARIFAAARRPIRLSANCS